MSTEIVVAEYMSEAVANYGSQALTGVPEDYAMTDDEQEEAANIFAGLRIVSLDGSEGRYRDLDTEKDFDNLKGAVLANLTDGQIWFPADDEKAEWPDTWLCRSFSIDHPPVLHPQLDAEDRSRALALGAGRSCHGCPLREFGSDDSPPRCSARSKILFFAAEIGEVVVLEVGGKSIKFMRAYLKQLKKIRIGKKPAAFYAFATQLAAEKIQDPEDKQRKWYEFRAIRGDLMPREAFMQLRSMRSVALEDIEGYLKALAERHEDMAALPAAPAQAALPPAAAPPSSAPAPSGGGLQLGADGNVVMPGSGGGQQEDQQQLPLDQAINDLNIDDIPF